LNITPPASTQGQAFLGPDQKAPRDYIYAMRNRMDERYDPNYATRDKRFLYVRYYHPWLPYYQYTNTAEKGTILQELRRLADTGELPEDAQWFTALDKPAEALYDTDADPHNIHNLAADPKFAAELARLRTVHETWQVEIRDTGLIPEHDLVLLEQRYGSRYAGMLAITKNNPEYLVKLRELAVRAGRPGAEDAEYLREHAKLADPVFRWWAVTGLGLLGDGDNTDVLIGALGDAAPTVRVAAAQALCRLDTGVEDALTVLQAEALGKREWVRLAAVLALDEIGELARPAIPILKESLRDRENKYVVRVANHALNVLLGTDNDVR
jgi:uncharacterized sulfatase